MALKFGGKDNDLSSFENGKVVVVPVPYGKTVSYKKGTDKAPAAILKSSDNLELFDEELKKETYKIGISTLPSLNVKGCRVEKMIKKVEKALSNVYKKKKFPVVIGGEHSVTIGAVRAAKKYYKDLSVLYFDAHYDLKDTYDGSKYSHACVARRLLETVKIVEVGVRSLSNEEHDFLPNNNIKVITMLDALKNQDWCKGAKGFLSEHVYISIDLDVFDPSIMPALGTPEP